MKDACSRLRQRKQRSSPFPFSCLFVFSFFVYPFVAFLVFAYFVFFSSFCLQMPVGKGLKWPRAWSLRRGFYIFSLYVRCFRYCSIHLVFVFDNTPRACRCSRPADVADTAATIYCVLWLSSHQPGRLRIWLRLHCDAVSFVVADEASRDDEKRRWNGVSMSDLRKPSLSRSLPSFLTSSASFFSTRGRRCVC